MAELLRRATAVLPGGALATYLPPQEFQMVIDRGEGCMVTDVGGHQYIDYVLGSGPMIVGHAHPAVLAAAHARLDRGTQFYTLTEPAISLSEKLVAAIPCADQVKLSSSGAEATFYALRLARAFTGRPKILKFAGAYHGFHDYAMFDSAIATAGIPGAVDSTIITVPFNDVDEATSVIEENASELAAVIVEPVQRTVLPRPGFLEGLRSVTAATGTVLIFDEMVTGFRVAFGGGQERYGVVPDLATYGKALGGGAPLSAVAGRRALMELVDPTKESNPDYVYMSGTLNGNPLGCAMGAATIDVLAAPGVFDSLLAMSERLRAGFAEVAAGAPFPLQVVSAGAFVGTAFAEGDVHDPATWASSDRQRSQAVEIGLLRRGILVNIAAKFYVSTAHDAPVIDKTIDAFADAVADAGKVTVGS